MSRPPQRQRPSQERRETYPLPEDTREMLEKVTGEPQNYGLRIDRLLLCNKETWEPTKRSKERFIPSKNGKKVLTFTDDVASILRACRARLEAILDAYRNAGWEVRPVTLRAASRVIVGLGAESVLETSIRLHRVYGFPILPGSALKGLTRAYALWEIATKLGIPPLSYKELAEREQSKKQTPLQKLKKCIEEVEPEKPKQQQLLKELQTDPDLPPEAPIRQLDIEAFDREVDPLRCIFGVAGQAGKVIFFDAVPANPANLKLELDVMNPHYAPYYQGTQPPADYHNPVPVFFLTIGPGSEFLFAVASREARLAEKAQDWLEKALTKMGIGAKTVAGYGLWNR